MRISVLTPCFNAAPFLNRAIDSVRAQNRTAEHLVADGGSTDQSVSILAARSSELTWWVSEPDRGQADALNKALARASGDIIGWLNADEYYEPDIFDLVARQFEQDPDLCVVYGGINLVLTSGQRIRTSYPARFDYEICAFNSPIITNCAAFFRRDRLVSCGGFDTSYQFAMDAEMYLRFMKGGAKWKRILSPLANFTLHPASKTSTMQQVMREETMRMRRREFPHYSDRQFRQAWKRASRRLQWSLLRDGLIWEKLWFNTAIRPRYKNYFGDEGPQIPIVGPLASYFASRIRLTPT